MEQGQAGRIQDEKDLYCMIIGGFQKFSLIDYPGKISAVIFTRGCNFRCPFCHNPELVLPDQYSQQIPEEQVFALLKKRINQLDGVVITGGEPTMHKDLDVFMSIIKELGYNIKLDTNGTFPGTLQKLINNELVDYIAMDIKAPMEKYEEATDSKVNADSVLQSIEIIKSSRVEHMFRTTVVKGLHELQDLVAVQKLVGEQSKYVLQYFHPSEKIIQPDLAEKSTYTQTEIEHFQHLLQSNDPVLQK